jgi:hypothetical protein
VQVTTDLQFVATPYNLTTAKKKEELTFKISQNREKNNEGQPTPVQILATKPQKNESIKITQITDTKNLFSRLFFVSILASDILHNCQHTMAA